MAQSDKPAPFGSIINNQGIITHGQHGNNTIINPIYREPNGLYQGNTQIGDAYSVVIDENNQIASFDAFHLTKYPDPTRSIEYKNLLISADNLPQPRPNTYIGTLSIMIAGFKAKIVGRR